MGALDALVGTNAKPNLLKYECGGVMQTLIDIPEEDLTRLDKLSEARQVPRDELVRTALSAYLDTHRIKPKRTKEEREKALDASFGAWAGMNGDGLEYQQRMRDEWPK